MASMDITEKAAVYNDEENQPHVLLDFTKYLANKSRVSLHKGPGWDIPTLPEILAGLFQKEKEYGEGLCLPTLLLDTLIAARLIQTSQPVHVLEYGCKDGRLSWHLAELLGRFHPETSLVCAYHTMDEEWVKWMERVYQVNQPPKISFLSGEYGRLQLQKDHFDIVLINGMVNFTEPEKVILDALSLAKSGGMILCYAEEVPLLEDIFKLYFEGCDEYSIMPSVKVLATKASDQSWEPMPDITEQVQEDLKEAEHIRTEEKPNRENLKKLIERLHRDAQEAAKLGKIDLKLRLIDEKEKMVEFAYMYDTLTKG